MGFRPAHTLAMGFHLHIDDLVVDETLRGKGIGKALLGFAENEARSKNMNSMLLNTRRSAIPFYENNEFIHVPSPSMKKTLPVRGAK